MGEFIDFLSNNLADFWTYTGFANATAGHLIMLVVGLFFIYLAIAKEFEPMLLIPIGFGILVGNIPFNMDAGLQVGIYEEGSVLNILYQGVTSGWYPPLIFLGIGAMTDFSALISNPKLLLIGAAAQHRCGCPVWHLRCLHDCPAMGLRPDAGCRHRYHRRCRRSYGHLPFLEAGSEPDGCHRRVGLFVHGIGTGYPTAHHAPADHQARTPHPHETAPRGVAYGEC